MPDPIEAIIDDQAAWLDQRTPLSSREAETLVREAIRGDVPKQNIASTMGVNPSTFSNHLSAAHDAIDKPDIAIGYWLFFGPGPLNPAAFQGEVVWTNRGAEWVLAFENQFPEFTNTTAPAYYVIHHYPDPPSPDALDDETRDRLADARIRHVTDRYQFDSVDDLQTVLTEALEFSSAQKRDRFTTCLDQYCADRQPEATT